MRSRSVDDFMEWFFAGFVAVLFVAMAVCIGALIVRDFDGPQKVSETVTVTVPSSVVGGMGMPGKAGSGMQWNREEEVRDAS